MSSLRLDGVISGGRNDRHSRIVSEIKGGQEGGKKEKGMSNKQTPPKEAGNLSRLVPPFRAD